MWSIEMIMLCRLSSWEALYCSPELNNSILVLRMLLYFETKKVNNQKVSEPQNIHPAHILDTLPIASPNCRVRIKQHRKRRPSKSPFPIQEDLSCSIARNPKKPLTLSETSTETILCKRHPPMHFVWANTINENISRGWRTRARKIRAPEVSCGRARGKTLYEAA